MVQVNDKVVWTRENGDREMAVVVGHTPDKAWVDVMPVSGTSWDDTWQVRAECVEVVEED